MILPQACTGGAIKHLIRAREQSSASSDRGKLLLPQQPVAGSVKVAGSAAAASGWGGLVDYDEDNGEVAAMAAAATAAALSPLAAAAAAAAATAASLEDAAGASGRRVATVAAGTSKGEKNHGRGCNSVTVQQRNSVTVWPLYARLVGQCILWPPPYRLR